MWSKGALARHADCASRPHWRSVLGGALTVDLLLLVATACGIGIGVLHIGDTDHGTERAQIPIAIPSAVPIEAVLCVAGVAVLIGGVLLLATTVRLIWRGMLCARSIRSVRTSPCPELSAAAAGLVPSGRLFQLVDERPYALCIGLWRPGVYVSAGLIGRLAPDALRAAIAHEESHRRRRDPLRLLLLRVTTQGGFSAWWPTGVLSSAELRAEITADHFARVHVSTAALASALLEVLRPHAGAQPFREDTAGVGLFPLRLDGASHVDTARLLDERLRYLALPLDAALPRTLPGLPTRRSLPGTLRMVVRGLVRAIAPILLTAVGGAMILAILVLSAPPAAISCPLHV